MIPVVGVSSRRLEYRPIGHEATQVLSSCRFLATQPCAEALVVPWKTLTLPQVMVGHLLLVILAQMYVSKSFCVCSRQAG